MLSISVKVNLPRSRLLQNGKQHSFDKPHVIGGIAGQAHALKRLHGNLIGLGEISQFEVRLREIEVEIGQRACVKSLRAILEEVFTSPYDLFEPLQAH